MKKSKKNFEDGTDRLSPNVGIGLPLYAKEYHKRAQMSSSQDMFFVVKPKLTPEIFNIFETMKQISEAATLRVSEGRCILT